MSVMAFFLYIVLSVFVTGTLVNGHGRLMDPPGRSSIWRYGLSAPVNYFDNQLWCGGFGRMHNDNGGRCGICGDPWDEAQPRDNEAGGRFGRGFIPRAYAQGQVITVKVVLTANHMGYHEFRICPNNNPTRIATQACLDQYVLPLADGTGTRVPVPANKYNYNIRLRLPAQLRCSQCVLQWSYTTGNNWGVCSDGGGALGCGRQELFRGCADVAIGDAEYSLYTSINLAEDAPQVPIIQPAILPPISPPLLSDGGATSGNNRPISGPCVGVGEWKAVRGIVNWCLINCARGYCPRSHCACAGQETTRAQKRLVCRSVGIWTWFNGMTEWCNTNCNLGTCPSTHCTCT